MSVFEWTSKKTEAVLLLAEGHTIEETALLVGVAERTIFRWKDDTTFSEELDRLSLESGIAKKAERLRIAKRIIRTKAQKEVPSKKDLLEWLKYVQTEMEGMRLDIPGLDKIIVTLKSDDES